MSDCKHEHTGSCSPDGVYLYVTCMNCGTILAESDEGRRRWESCPGFEAKKYSPGSCKHCHISAQQHYDALRQRVAECEKIMLYYGMETEHACMCSFANEGDAPVSECEYHAVISARLAAAEALIQKLEAKAAHFEESYRLLRAVLPMERWAEDSKRMIDAHSEGKP